MTRPARQRPAPRITRVRRVERLSASLVRIVVGGEALAGFNPEHADSYVKVLFADPVSPAERPRMRTYTVRRWDATRLELTLDFVVHGTDGVAGPWAAAAQVGDEVVLQGPGGGYQPNVDADWHLLVGDESALPAIAVALEQLPAGARAYAFIEVHGPEDEMALAAAPGIELRWVHRGIEPLGARLVDEVRALEFPDGAVHAFVHGEAGFVKQLRHFLRVERAVPLELLSISGYWRAGVDDEGWRAVKADWNRDVATEESAALAPAAAGVRQTLG